MKQILKNLTWLIDGPFEIDKRDITLSSLAKSFTDYIYKGYDENHAYIAALTDEFGGS